MLLLRSLLISPLHILVGTLLVILFFHISWLFFEKISFWLWFFFESFPAFKIPLLIIIIPSSIFLLALCLLLFVKLFLSHHLHVFVIFLVIFVIVSYIAFVESFLLRFMC